MTDAARQHLEKFRHPLLALHKALVDSERMSYEQVVGPVQSPGRFLQLLTRDPWFAWLQPLSQLIVSIDEALEQETALTPEDVDAAIRAARTLLTPSESGEGFSRHYFDALQRDPDVVLAHAEVTRLLGPRTK